MKPPLRLSDDPRIEHGVRVTLLGAYPVASALDAFPVRAAVRRHARALGFGQRAVEELALIATELCTNIVKYGVRGAIEVERVEHPQHGIGVVLAAEDVGPPFHDFGRAIRDGSDDHGSIPPDALFCRKGIGAGLGAVQRLSHGLWLEALTKGKRVVAVRFVEPRV